MRCRSCGKEVDNRLVICPSCGAAPSVDGEINLTPKQVKQISRQFRKEFITGLLLWIGLLSLVFGVGLLQIYQSAIQRIKILITERVSKEFEQPMIRETVQSVASRNAEQILLQEIRPEVDKFKNEIQKPIDETKQLAASAQKQFDDLTALIEIEDEAHFGSRKAYLELNRISSGSDQLAGMAKRRALSVTKELLIYRSVPGAYFGLSSTRNGQSVPIDQFSVTELFRILESPSLPKEHIPPLMACIANKPKNEVLQEAKRVLQDSDSLLACAATCGILTKILGDKADFLAFDDWIRVCVEEMQKSQ